MTTIQWANPISGGFTNAADWVGGVVPGPSDEAVLDAPGDTAYTVSSAANQTVDDIQTAATASLAIGSDTFTATAGSGTGVNAGTITVADGASIGLGGTFDDTGVLDLQGASKGADLRIVTTGLTLSGGGEVLLGDSLTAPYQPCPVPLSTDLVYSPHGVQATLDNIDDTIAGAGVIHAVGLTVANGAAGVIDASLATDLLLYSVGTLNNAGLIEATGAGGLYIVFTTIDNSSGGVIAADNGPIYLHQSTIIGGTITTTGDVALHTDYEVNTLDGETAGGVTNLGLILINSKTPLVVEGAIDNQGQIDMNGTVGVASLTVAAAGATLTGGGQIVLDQGSTQSEVSGALASATLTNVDNTISGQGRVGAGALTLINEAAGVIDVVDNDTLVLDTGAGSVVNAGLIEATYGRLAIVNTAIDGAGGTILAASGASVTLSGADLIGGALVSQGSGDIHTVSGTNVIDGTASAVDNQAQIVVAGGTGLTLEGAIDNTGSIDLWSQGSGSVLTIGAAGATLSGGGAVAMDDSAMNTIAGASSSATLANGGVIRGAGDLGDGAMTLVNDAGGVIAGTFATALTIDTGAQTIVNAGTILAAASGAVAIDSALENNGLLRTNGGTFTANGSVSGAGSVLIDEGEADFASSFSENVSFAAPSGELELAQSQGYEGTISGFSTTGGSSLDLDDIGFVSASEASFSGSAAGGVLTVTDGTHTASINLVGDYLSSTFTASSDGHGGALIVDPPKQGVTAHFVQAMAGLAPHSAALARSPVQEIADGRAMLLAAPAAIA